MRMASEKTVWLDDEPHREAYQALSEGLSLVNYEVAKAIEHSPASLSGATSLRSKNPRPIPAEKFTRLISYLDERISDLPTKDQTSLRVQLTLLISASDQSVVVEAEPGEIQHSEAKTAIRPHWLQKAKENLLGGSTSQPSSRIWLLGGPMTGKTSAVQALVSHAQRAGLETIELDIRKCEISPAVRLDHSELNVILKGILQHTFGNQCAFDAHEQLPVERLAVRFCEAVEREILRRPSRVGRVLSIDHFYLLGTQGELATPRLQKNFDEFNHALMVSLSKLYIKNTTIIIVDDLTSAASKDVSKHWTKGDPVICLVKTRDVIALWSEVAGVQISEEEANQTIEELGRSLFTHHAAAILCRSSGNVDGPTQAAIAIKRAITTGEMSNGVEFRNAIIRKRHRILKWLRLKASRIFAEYPSLLEAIIAGDYSIVRKDLSTIEGVEALRVAIEYSGLAHATVEPSQLLIEIAQEELVSQGDLK